MVITYVGGHCFKLSAGSTTIAVNPPRGGSKHKVSKFGSDIVLISIIHEDWDGEETASHGDKEPFVIRGPGAYEIGDVVVTGYASPSALQKETQEYGNTIYALQFDGMKVLLLGALSNAKLPQEVRADLIDVDIVFIPLGEDTLDSKGAHDLVVALEAKLVIPYAVDGKADLASFLKTAGAGDIQPVEKLTLRSKELSTMSGEIALLK